MKDSQPLFSTLSTPCLYLVYASTGLPTVVTREPKAFQPHSASIEWVQQNPQQCLGRVSLGEHQLHVAGLANPLPQEVSDRTIMVSPWGPQIKTALRQHQAHLSLVYTGGDPDPVEKMVALYTLASAFKDENLLGIVNPNAWTAHPTADFLSSERITQYRAGIPFNLWFGYVRFYTDDQAYWLVTKGHHIFDVPDLAYFVQPGEQADEVINIFINVFYYLYEQDVTVVAGDSFTVHGDNHNLVFSEVTELVEFLMGPKGTLVITRDMPANQSSVGS